MEPSHLCQFDRMFISDVLICIHLDLKFILIPILLDLSRINAEVQSAAVLSSGTLRGIVS